MDRSITQNWPFLGKLCPGRIWVWGNKRYTVHRLASTSHSLLSQCWPGKDWGLPSTSCCYFIHPLMFSQIKNCIVVLHNKYLPFHRDPFRKQKDQTFKLVSNKRLSTCSLHYPLTIPFKAWVRQALPKSGHRFLPSLWKMLSKKSAWQRMPGTLATHIR